MEKHIIRWSYFLGVLALALALVTRAMDVVAPSMNVIRTRGDSIGYRAFMNGALLFFITTIASACYAWFKSQSSQLLLGEDAWSRHKTNPQEIAGDLVSGDSSQANRN